DRARRLEGGLAGVRLSELAHPREQRAEVARRRVRDTRSARDHEARAGPAEAPEELRVDAALDVLAEAAHLLEPRAPDRAAGRRHLAEAVARDEGVRLA